MSYTYDQPCMKFHFMCNRVFSFEVDAGGVDEIKRVCLEMDPPQLNLTRGSEPAREVSGTLGDVFYICNQYGVDVDQLAVIPANW